jgi:competence protein ComEC
VAVSRVQALWEAQAGNGVLWAPVALTFGIWTYFSLPEEPALALAAVMMVLAAALFWFSRGRIGMVLLAVLISGFVLAKFRAEIVGTPLLKATTSDVVVTGIVRNLDSASPKRGIIILEPSAIEGMQEAQLPRRLRLTNFSKNGSPEIGAQVVFRARLAPISSPAMPGGFDYGRQIYFESIGGSGRITSTIDVLGQTNSPRLWLSRTLHELRSSIGKRIAAHLEGTIAALAEAMITGERASIPKDTNKSLQISGLAHILSISGLHMSLAAGGVFWAVRAILALFPTIAQRQPIKKWASAAALVFGFIYMLLAGSGAATQRSYIMLAVVFLAIIVDRPAISLRNLALAAIVILILQPESAIQASFQMSFLAVMGLAAFFEFWNRPQKEMEYKIENQWLYYGRKTYRILLASILTTLIAGAFSSIPAAYHFGRLAPFGVIANGLALPVMSLLVMPFALLSVLAMPFGLEAMPLAVLGKGLQMVLAISEWVAQMPGAQSVIPQLPIASAILLAIGASVICLTKAHAKYAGIVFLMAAAAFAQLRKTPDILIERTAANMAILNDAQELVFANAQKGRFATEKWLQANGEDVGLKEAAARHGWHCDGRLCSINIKGKTVGYAIEGEGAAPSCKGLDIVVAAYPLRKTCKEVKIRIDRFDVWRNGAHALEISNDAIVVTTARAAIGNRPWLVVPEPRRKPFIPQ